MVKADIYGHVFGRAGVDDGELCVVLGSHSFRQEDPEAEASFTAFKKEQQARHASTYLEFQLSGS